MAVNLNKVKQVIKEQYRAEDKALAEIQKYFDKNTSVKKTPTQSIKFTTDLKVGGYNAPISETYITTNVLNEVLTEQQKPIDRALRHSHNIEWEDIERAYKLQELIHSKLARAYYEQNKIYKGRSLYQKPEFKKALDDAGINIIKGQGSKIMVPWTAFGRHGRYGKIDVDIHRKVLHEIYDELYKATNTHLLEKFNSIDLTDGDFKKLIRGTQELLYDIKKAKDWVKEVEDLVNKAELEQKARAKLLNRLINQEQKKQDILTIDQLEKIGRAILGLAIEYCPIETGFLRSSGKLYVGNNDIRIIFECPYAVYVHDNPNAQHPIGRYHFLIDAAQEILPKTSVWTEITGDDSFVLGNYMKQTWDRDSSRNIVSDMYWKEHKGYQAVYIDIDTNLNINYAHRK